MSTRFALCVLLEATMITVSPSARAQDVVPKPPDKVYELRVYTAHEGKLDALHALFREHSIRILAKHGMESLYYWTVSEGAASDGEDAKNMLVYVLAHKSREAADASWAAFRADPEWGAVKARSEESGPLLSKPVVSIFMEPTAFSLLDEPVNGKSDAPARVFELRQYNDGEARLPGTVDRFAGWEAELFRKHGMTTVAFWTAMDKSAFIYLLAHKDRETSRIAWQGFFGEFREAQAAYNARVGRGPTTAPARGTGGSGRGGARGAGGGNQIRFLVPTDYSPRK